MVQFIVVGTRYSTVKYENFDWMSITTTTKIYMNFCAKGKLFDLTC